MEERDRKRVRAKVVSDSAKKRMRLEIVKKAQKKYREAGKTHSIRAINKSDFDRFHRLKNRKTKHLTNAAFFKEILDMYETGNTIQSTSETGNTAQSTSGAKRMVYFSEAETVKQKMKSTPAKSSVPLLHISDISSVHGSTSNGSKVSEVFISGSKKLVAESVPEVVTEGIRKDIRLEVSYGDMADIDMGQSATEDSDEEAVFLDLEGLKNTSSSFDENYDGTYVPGQRSIREYEEEQSYLADPTFDPFSMFDKMTVQERQLINEDDYEELDLMEEVFPVGSDEEDDMAEDDENVAAKQRITNPEDIVGKKFSMIMDDNLAALAMMKKPTSCHVKGCHKEIDVSLKHSGTSVNINWICRDGHNIQRWSGQPSMRRVNGGDFLLAASILTSGNNYDKIKRMCDNMGIGCISQTTYYNIQTHYLLPSVVQYWENMQNEILASLEDKEVVILGDGRMDSPGHSAKFCTYTIIEEQSRNIVAVMVVDKRQCELKSTNMELKAFRDGLDMLINRGVIVTEVVTDAHIQIAKLLRENYPQIKHSFDVWHGAKNLSKKVGAAGAEKGNEALLLWNQHIVNHFWHCAETCGKDKDVYLVKWAGMLHHVTDKHEWLLGHGKGPAKCDHKDLRNEERDKPWLEPYSKPHNKLRRIVFDTRFLNNIPKYVNYKHTGDIESFQNHILMYAGKRFGFTFDAYKARCLLAAIDYTKHKDRPNKLKTVLDANGEEVVKQHYKRKFSKKTKMWYVVPAKVTKTYDYIPDLHTLMVAMRLRDLTAMRLRAAKPIGHPDLISPTIAPTAPPPTEELIERHVSRFSKKQ